MTTITHAEHSILTDFGFTESAATALMRQERARQYAEQVRCRKALLHDCPHCQAKELEEVVIRITERWKQ